MQRLSSTIQGFLSDYVRGKDVLDVGCVDHTATLEATDTWLHKHIVRSATSAVGLDLLESEAAKLREKGYDIRSGDACSVSLDQTFDVVVAGEIIEHVGQSRGVRVEHGAPPELIDVRWSSLLPTRFSPCTFWSRFSLPENAAGIQNMFPGTVRSRWRTCCEEAIWRLNPVTTSPAAASCVVF